MHRVECSHCHKGYKLSAPVRNARMKCGKCGQVFVATSTEAAEAPVATVPSPAPQPAPASPSELLAKRRRRSALTVMIVSGLLLVSIVVAGLMLWYFNTHPVMVVKNPKTGVETRVRVSREEYERRKAEEKAKQEEVNRPATAKST